MISEAAIQHIKLSEGLRLESYPDPATGGEPWTIGYGHTSASGAPVVAKGMRISKDQADAILMHDIENAVARRNVCGVNELSQHHRLEQSPRSAFADRQIEIEIRKTGRRRRNEALPRDLDHGVEDAQIGHIGGADLSVHHVPASGCEIGHRVSRSEEGRREERFLCGNKPENASFAMRLSCDCRGALAPI